nr:hypothetical protein [uncultured Rhodopila sp.]
MSDGEEISEEEKDEMSKEIAGQCLPLLVDRPLKFHFCAQTGALQVWAASNPMLNRVALPLLLNITAAATQDLLLLAEAIRTNPGKDIEGYGREPNVQ